MSITVKNIHKKFGAFVALNNVSLDVAPGELVALLGPSGSGKTTLLRIIAGLENADSGEVWIGGQNTAELGVRERQVGFVFQHYALFKHMDVFDNVAFGLRVRPRHMRLSDSELRERVMALLKLVHLDSFHDRYPSQLSGGQRQRVALARSLAVEPKLLLLDEPFGALDAKVRTELRRWLRRLHEEMNITTLFVTHDQEEAMEVANRVVVMNRGAVEQVGTPEEVYGNPGNGFVYDFLGNYNEFAGWKTDDGAVHLAEDDMWESALPATPAVAGNQFSSRWLARYPEVANVLGKIWPKLGSVKAPPASAMRPTVGSKLSERGIPVRVFVRPHEMFLAEAPEPTHEYIPVTVEHINPAGALVKLELLRKNGTILQAEAPKSLLESLRIVKHRILYVRPKEMRVFE